ncbi:YdeI family protein [Pedobacter sp. Leaf250]|uniref:YdeI/OmpD-associated family protein n=1 Tax=Pedobacter sp. Leaf250 TaxID=2876559 RepID=UPI001E30923E|nr:YdeI/OmpD-associated family protein [Pedobacter sp. Leaf250]
MENLFLKKLKVKPGNKVNITGAPANATSIFGQIPDTVNLSFDNLSSSDVLIFFVLSKEQLDNQIESYLNYINAKTIFWVFYPKKSSKIKSDLDLMKSWQELSKYRLAPCSSICVDETWTGLRLKFEMEIKPSGMRNDHIKTNLYGEYIDPDTKTVKLPSDLEVELSQHPTALNYFDTLAYSHKKEYVLWVISAKQDATRSARIVKMINLLLKNKKNPSDKN